MLSRLLITLAIILIFDIKSSWVIATGILLSFVFGLFPFKIKQLSFKKTLALEKTYSKQIKNFFLLTAFYELTQIIINNSDILLVIRGSGFYWTHCILHCLDVCNAAFTSCSRIAK